MYTNIVCVIAHVLLHANTIRATASIVTDQLWTNLFANQKYLINVGPWLNDDDTVKVYFQSDLQSVENVVSKFRRRFFEA